MLNLRGKYCVKKIFVLLVSCSFVQAAEVNLRLYEKRLISQNGEDGVINKIFQLIGTTSKYYVEFGAGRGHYASNTKYLREKFGWQGLLLEGRHRSDPSINLHQAFITAENICDLFAQYRVPHEFDLCSIDIDRNDWYVWKALGREYRPRVVIIEFQQIFNWNDDKVIKYDARAVWDSSEYTGASILALYRLGRYLGYSLVYQESMGANLFFIRNDIVANLEARGIRFLNINNVEKIYTGTPIPLDARIACFVAAQGLLP